MDTVRVPFRYALRQLVTYAGTRWTVAARRYQEGTVSRFVQVGLVPEGETEDTAPLTWVYEPDVEEVPDGL